MLLNLLMNAISDTDYIINTFPTIFTAKCGYIINLTSSIENMPNFILNVGRN